LARRQKSFGRIAQLTCKALDPGTDERSYLWSKARSSKRAREPKVVLDPAYAEDNFWRFRAESCKHRPEVTSERAVTFISDEPESMSRGRGTCS
jgi:hypothetical protein